MPETQILEEKIKFLEKRFEYLESKTYEQDNKINEIINFSGKFTEKFSYLSFEVNKISSNISKLTFILLSSIVLSIIKYFFKF